MLSLVARQELESGWQAAEDTVVRLARTNIRAFFNFVMRDEETGQPVEMCEEHEAWHQLSDQYDRLMLWSYMESGKTAEISVARTLWELGRDPTLRFVIASNTSGMAIKIANQVGKYIKESPELHRVFPHLVPDESMPWNSEQLTVKRPTLSKDPSVNTIGCGSNTQGARIDRAILDDVLNRENTRTKYMRDETMDWYLKTIPGRMTARGRIIGIGNAWNPDDLYHRLAKNKRWRGFKFPILKRDGSSAWPARWPLSRIEARKQELGPLESKSQLMCEALDDATSRFKKEWIERCKANGEGKSLVYALRAIPAGCGVYIGVDLAVGRKKANARTVYFVLLIHPNGDRQVLWIEAGQFLADEIMNRVVNLHARFHGIFVVENVQAQDYLCQLLTKYTAIPIIPFTTGKNKADPSFGIEAMGVEFANGKWIIPNDQGRCDPEVETWIGELLSYHPDSHTGDSVMSSWFAKEGERVGYVPPPPTVGTVHLNLSNW